MLSCSVDGRAVAGTSECTGEPSYTIFHLPYCMKLLQARVPEAEFEMLRRKAKAEGKTIQEWVRVALHERLLSARVVPNDQAFLAFPLLDRPKGARTNHAEHHDELLYGSET